MSIHSEILRYIDAKTKPTFSGLKEISSFQRVLTDWDISRSVEWILDRCLELEASDPSIGQRAASSFLKFLATTKLKNRESLELIAWICISLSLKTRGDAVSTEQLKSAMESRFTVASIVMTELFITKQIRWDVNTPTLYEVQYLLLSPLKETDASLIMDGSKEFNAKCYTEYTRLEQGLVVLAMGFILRQMQKMSLKSSHEEFLSIYQVQFSEEIALSKKLFNRG